MSSIALHQALHGYSDGHRALESSIELNPTDAKALLVLSDISGPGMRPDSSGYLTGYPLVQSGLYALARTWPAPEMSRPGCVWTHTLLIDFLDLAILTDLSQLIDLFRRPESPISTPYKNKVLFEENLQHTPLSKSVIANAIPLISALYEFPSKPVVSFDKVDRKISEGSVLALWAQQWPRLRRSFRFCTLATADRSTEESPFDLQLLPESMPSLKSRFANAIDANHPIIEPDWLPIAINELSTSQFHGLRQFLYQAGSDLPKGRASFATLCRIFGALEGFERTQPDIQTVLELMPDASDINSGRAVKRIVLQRLLKQGAYLSSSASSFIVEHLDLLGKDIFNYDVIEFGKTLLNNQPKLFLKMCRSGEVGERVLQKTLGNIQTKDILAATKESAEILPIALKARPELLEEPATWRLIDNSYNYEAIETIFHKNISQHVLVAVITAERYEFADVMLDNVPLKIFMIALHHAYQCEVITDEVLRSWLILLSTPSAVSDLLVSFDGLDIRFLYVVSKIFEPDSLPSNSQTDPWLQAIEGSVNTLLKDEELSLRSYLLTRSLYDHIQNAGELARYGFEATDRALASNQLSNSQWTQLEHQLPWSIFWPTWDRCLRLRKGVLERCIEDRWSAEVFVSLVDDDELFSSLVSIAKYSHHGRQYLKAVKESVKGSSTRFIQKRHAMIEQILKGDEHQ